MSIGIAEAFSGEQIDSQFQVNTFAPMRMTKAVLPAMRQSRSGLIVHVSFVVGRVLLLGCAYYCASKSALEGFVEPPARLAVELLEPGPS